MKDQIAQKAGQGISSMDRMNRLREELHHLLLQEADRKGAFRDMCFVGGTALRIVYGLDRFSEDLDFFTSALALKSFDLEHLAKGLRESLEAFGLDCQVKKLKTANNVKSCFFVFDDILHRADRSFPRSQKLAIKFDIDMNPPGGGVEMVSPVTGDRLYKVRHYELPSLFAGKLHAILCRKYTKGRDLYDFLWYVGKKTPVNVRMLELGFKQTENETIQFNQERLRSMLSERFQKVDFAQAKEDVKQFLVDARSLDLLEPHIFSDVVKHFVLEPV